MALCWKSWKQNYYHSAEIKIQQSRTRISTSAQKTKETLDEQSPRSIRFCLFSWQQAITKDETLTTITVGSPSLPLRSSDEEAAQRRGRHRGLDSRGKPWGRRGSMRPRANTRFGPPLVTMRRMAGYLRPWMRLRSTLRWRFAQP